MDVYDFIRPLFFCKILHPLFHRPHKITASFVPQQQQQTTLATQPTTGDDNNPTG